jgi:hypothetical protein
VQQPNLSRQCHDCIRLEGLVTHAPRQGVAREPIPASPPKLADFDSSSELEPRGKQSRPGALQGDPYALEIDPNTPVCSGRPILSYGCG